MRSILFAILMAASAAAQEWSVQIAPPRKRFVTKSDLVIHCRDRAILGCTELLGEMLRCECRRTGDAWSMTAHAQFLPYMYVTRPDVEAHEHEHLADLREQTSRYAADLTTRRFADDASCRGAAEFEMATFSLRLDLFRKISNARLR